MKQAILVILATACIAILATWREAPTSFAQDGVDLSKPEPAPLIDNYEIMEILMDPVYEKLKDSVSIEPTRRKDWRAIYLSAYTLGEQANLLFSRNDEDYMTTPEWDALTVEMRQLCADIGTAVKAKDYPAIKKSYEALIANCNACHVKFEGEEDATIVEPWDL